MYIHQQENQRDQMAQQKIPDIVLKFQQLAKPTFVNSRWRKPAVSGRRLAEVRKALVAKGVYWPPKPLTDRGADKPLKLIKHEREREERQKRIEENMRKMPAMIAEYRKSMYKLRADTRAKKHRTDEMKYHIAMGKQEGGEPTWQIFKNQKR